MSACACASALRVVAAHVYFPPCSRDLWHVQRPLLDIRAAEKTEYLIQLAPDDPISLGNVLRILETGYHLGLISNFESLIPSQIIDLNDLTAKNNALFTLAWLVDHGLLQPAQVEKLNCSEWGLDYLIGKQATVQHYNPFFCLLGKIPYPMGGVLLLNPCPLQSILHAMQAGFSPNAVETMCRQYLSQEADPLDLRFLVLIQNYVSVAYSLPEGRFSEEYSVRLFGLINQLKSLSADQVKYLILWYPDQLYFGLSNVRIPDFYKHAKSPECKALLNAIPSDLSDPAARAIRQKTLKLIRWDPNLWN